MRWNPWAEKRKPDLFFGCISGNSLSAVWWWLRSPNYNNNNNFCNVNNDGSPNNNNASWSAGVRPGF
ncbi:DUF6273 domain-containing protein [Acutalibacter caecimuris]|uniref:DUF6273 domain-containing protein n=1 Tax=Acutalibacter caecimuris TaxID=3093657 RepID=UPI003460FF5C